MATGRMLKKSITKSEQVNSLKVDTALFYTWCLPYLDDFGLLWGSFWKIKHEIFSPRKNFTEGKIGKFIIECQESKDECGVGLIKIVAIEGKKWLWFPTFYKHQTLKKDRAPQTHLAVKRDWSFFSKISGFGVVGNKRKILEDNGTQCPPEVKLSEVNLSESKRERDGNVPFPTPAQQMRYFISSYREKDEGYDEIIIRLGKKGVPEAIAKTEIKKFVNYWTEKNKSGTKEKWEIQQTFEVEKRLNTWFSRIEKFKSNKQRTFIQA